MSDLLGVIKRSHEGFSDTILIIYLCEGNLVLYTCQASWNLFSPLRYWDCFNLSRIS